MGHPQNQFDDVPLARFEVFRSSSCDEIVHHVSNALVDHQMEIRNPGKKKSDARMNRVELGGCALAYIEQGVEVSIDTATLESRYLLFTDLGSETQTEVLGESFDVAPDTAALYSPSSAAHIRMGAKAKHLHLTLDRAAVERHLETLTGVTVRGPIVFEPRLSLTSNGGALLKDLIRLLIERLDDGDDLLQSPLVIANLEDTLMTTLLTGHRHSHAGRFENKPAALVPRQVELVEDYIQANADRPLKMKDLAAVANVSARSIQQAFRRHRGYSPKAFLNSVRLERARESLLTARVGESITRTALDCGFAHLGRFSSAYRMRFGESPSQTLRKHQRTQAQ